MFQVFPEIKPLINLSFWRIFWNFFYQLFSFSLINFLFNSSQKSRNLDREGNQRTGIPTKSHHSDWFIGRFWNTKGILCDVIIINSNYIIEISKTLNLIARFLSFFFLKYITIIKFLSSFRIFSREFELQNSENY